jgi:4,5-DOPA dioxygenase extradiol
MNDTTSIVGAKSSRAVSFQQTLTAFRKNIMTTAMPTLFISHGAPTLAIEKSPAHQFLLELGKSLPRPKAILIASAHWESLGDPAVSLAQQPETIHDFGGFPEALYAIQYPAQGAPEVAAHAADLMGHAGFAVKRSPSRGLDHGAWVPLRLLYPDATIPVAQISVVRGATQTTATHEQMGKALAPLREDGVLIIGSGSMTHNLYEFRGDSINAEVPEWVSGFDEWMKTQLDNNQREALRNYRARAPFATRNHPSEEHLLPLFVAMGAAGDAAKAERVHSSYEYGVLAMDVYAFTATTA